MILKQTQWIFFFFLQDDFSTFIYIRAVYTVSGSPILSLGHLHVFIWQHFKCYMTLSVIISRLAGDSLKVSGMMKSIWEWLMRKKKWLMWIECKTSHERKSDKGNKVLHDDMLNSTTPASIQPSVHLSLLLHFSLSSNISLCFPHRLTFDLSFHNSCSWHWKLKPWREAMQMKIKTKLPARYILELSRETDSDLFSGSFAYFQSIKKSCRGDYFQIGFSNCVTKIW